SIPLRDDSLRLFDCDPGLQCMLELRSTLVGRMSHGEQACHRNGRLLDSAELDLAVLHPGRSLLLVTTRLQLDDEVAVECIGDPKERVDPGRSTPALQPGDRRLRRADELRQLALREPTGLSTLGDLVRDCGEEPAAIGGPNPFLQALERALARFWHCMHAMASGRRTGR